MNAPVNVLILPSGAHVVRGDDDATAKAEALRLGLLPAVCAALRKHAGSRGAAGIARDGDRLVAVIAWDGFESAEDNGWASLSITPACEETANWLVGAVSRLIDATNIRFEGGAPWRN